MANYFNSERYPDPTSYTAIKNIEKQEKLKPKSKKKQKIRSEEAKQYGHKNIFICILFGE